MKTFLSRLFLFVGLLCIVFLVILLYQRYRPNPLAFAKTSGTMVLAESTAAHGLPVRLKIPNVAIDLSVYPATVHNTTWETTDKGVSYLESSALPGSTGNAIFYGHNWPNLLGPLKNTNVGDTIKVSFADGSVVAYTVEFITIVKPEQTKILDNSEDSRLTIYTCTGFLDQKRFVVTAVKN
ncbi:MAG: sortase [bacterium]|nr:sortase [bacterium]